MANNDFFLSYLGKDLLPLQSMDVQSILFQEGSGAFMDFFQGGVVIPVDESNIQLQEESEGVPQSEDVKPENSSKVDHESKSDQGGNTESHHQAPDSPQDFNEVRQDRGSALRDVSMSNLKLTGQIIDGENMTQGSIELGALYGGRGLSSLQSVSQANESENIQRSDNNENSGDGSENPVNAVINFAPPTEAAPPSNGNPNAVNDGVLALTENGSLSVNVLSNDSDPDGNTLTITQVDGADITEGGGAIAVANGTVSLVAGELVFTATSNYSGFASFNYTVSDGKGAVDTATVDLKVLPVSFELSSLDGSNGFVLNGINGGDNSGRSVSSVGDINGDGYDDFIIGARNGDPNGSNSGESYVVFGNMNVNPASINLSSLDGTNGFVINGVSANNSSGLSVSSAGDMNGDGLSDLLIGSAGRSYVVLGNAGGYGASFELSSLDGTNGFSFNAPGYSVSSAGDINGDGLADIIVADYPSEKSYVIFGDSGGFAASLGPGALNGTNGFAINGTPGTNRSGYSVSSAGDINGDGLSDFIVTAPRASPNGFQSGEAYVVFGQTGGYGASFNLSSINGTNGFVINGSTASEQFGMSSSSAGDINGDGYDDFIISTEWAGPNGIQSGQSYVFFGKAGGYAASLDISSLNGTNGFAINGVDIGDHSGISVSSAGDFNGDGYDDLLIGAYAADPNGLQSGETYMVYGTSTGFGASLELSALDGTNGFVLNGVNGSDFSGYSVSSAGDINGDGFDDLLIGAYQADPNGSASGASYIVYGGDEYNANDINLGTSGNDTLTGTAGVDTLIGDQGNDSLYSQGGADVLYGGSGDDTVYVTDDTFFKVDGGSGYDSLVWDNGGTLDLTSLSGGSLEGLELIDLSANSGDLTLGSLEVFNLSDTSNTLRVEGDADNTVNLQDGGWTNTGPLVDGGQTYTVYTQGEAVVQIDTDVVVVI